MLWTEALEIVVAKTKCERYRTLCADSSPFPDKIQAYRRRVLELARQDVQSYPPVAAMAQNLARSLLRAAGDGFKVVDAEERERRMGICRECPFFRPDHQACAKCGCRLSLKTRLASSHCPESKW